MRIGFADKTIAALKPKPERYEMQDAHCPGLSLRITPEGRKTFGVKYRHGVKQRRMAIGVYPRISLAEARARAMEAMRQVDEGTFDTFADAAYAEVEAGTLAGEFLPILDILREWDAGGVWVLAHAR